MLVVALLDGLWGSLLALLLNTTTPDVVPLPTTGIGRRVGRNRRVSSDPDRRGAFLPRLQRHGVAARPGRTLGADPRRRSFFAVVHVVNIVVEPNAQGAFDGHEAGCPRAARHRARRSCAGLAVPAPWTRGFNRRTRGVQPASASFRLSSSQAR